MSAALSRQCRTLRRWLPEYAEEKLSGRRRAAVADHLAGCPRCTREVAGLRAMLASLHAAKQEAVPAHLLAALHASLRAPAAARHIPVARRAPSLWARLAVPIAAATGLVAIAFALHQSSPPERAVTRPPASEAVPAAAPARRTAAPVISPSPTARPTTPPRAASGGRRLGPPLPREQVMGRGPAPSLAQAESAPPVEESQAKQMQESVRGPAGSPGPPVSAEAATARTEDRAAAAVARPPARAGGQGGGGFAGRGARGAAPPSRPRSWRGMPPKDYVGLPGRRIYAERRRPGRGPRSRRGLGPGPTALRAEQAARPPANAVVVQTARGQAIALHLEPSMGRKVKVYAGNQMIRPAEGGAAGSVLLPADSLGAAPAQVLITVSSEAGDWKYTLFTPGVSQLGRQQSTAVKRYQLEPLSQVLSDLSTQSGLVLLVEGSTDTKVEGELPLASPKDAVALLAEAAKLDVYTEDGVVYTLRPRR